MKIVEITNCSNVECIGFIGQIVNKETFSKITHPFNWQEIMSEIDKNQIMIIGEGKSFISDKNGFVEYVSSNR